MKKTLLLALTISFLLLGGCAEPIYTNESDPGNEDHKTDITDESEKELNNSEEKTQEEYEKKIAYLKIGITGREWDSDPEVDGLEISLAPKTLADEVVRTKSHVDVKLWNFTCKDYSESRGECIESECIRSEDKLLEDWNVSLDEDDFGMARAIIRAEYENYKPSEDENGSPKGCLLVTLKTRDKEIPAEEDFISLK